MRGTRHTSGKGLPLAFFLLLPLAPLMAPAEDAGGAFPFIGRLDGRDTAFRQYIADVESNRQRVFNRERNRESPAALAQSLTIYQYTPQEGEDLFSLAARCNIPYAALASLNRLSHPALPETGTPLLLPSIPGIFIPAEPETDLERLLAAARLSRRGGESVALTVSRSGTAEIFHFCPGADFTATERVFFLNSGFRFPLRAFTLTSPYGVRQNPVTGVIGLHGGLDLAAPEGAEVFAAAEGTVTEIGNDPVYGNYVVIRHRENWASLYGHLRSVETTLRSLVRSGTLIGRVGSTGQSTGPHLHFELRQNGRARDPGKLLFQAGGQ
ncbi:MAG: M23 family metallopeptidase [Treponema sp.]|nr:M23 family metallopeptidase [Treponema sp.]